MNSWFRKIIFYLFLLGLWWGLAAANIWPPYLFPSPRGVWQAMASGIADHTILLGTWVSMKRILVGYFISLIAGTFVGVLVGRSRWLDDTVGSLISGLQGLPSICWLPLAILWFGISELSIQFVVIMGAFLAIAMAMDDGIKNIPPLYVRAALTMGTSRQDTVLRVILPAALPSIVTGMKLGWSFAWRALMAGELLTSVPGLGQMLNRVAKAQQLDQLLAIMLLIAIIGVAIDGLIFKRLERAVRVRWGLV